MIEECRKILQLIKEGKWKEAKIPDWLQKPGPNIKDGIQTIGLLKEALKPEKLGKTLKQGGKSGAIFGALISTMSNGYKLYKDEIHIVDAVEDILKQTTGGAISSAIGNTAGYAAGVVLIAITPAGWIGVTITIGGSLLVGTGTGIVSKKGCDTLWETCTKTETVENFKNDMKDKSRFIKFAKLRYSIKERFVGPIIKSMKRSVNYIIRKPRQIFKRPAKNTAQNIT
jgi:hypothetical protein